jgi:hypothetical protein
MSCLWSVKATGRSVCTGGWKAWQLRKDRDTAAMVSLTQPDGATQGGAMTDVGSGSEGPDRLVSGRSVSAIDLIVATALLALLAFAPLAHLAATAQPLAPEARPRLATLTGNNPIVWCATSQRLAPTCGTALLREEPRWSRGVA